MNRHPHRQSGPSLVLENQPALAETYIVAEEWITNQVEGESQAESFLTESIYTTAVHSLGEDLDEAEGDRGIQIIDLAEEDEGIDDEDEEVFDQELDEELDDEGEDDGLDEDLEAELEDGEEEANYAYQASPALTSGDRDANGKRAEVTGEETPGGTVTTPDQDVVDQIGRAAGVIYDDDEPLDFAEKNGQRDRERWELDPASVDPDMRALSEEVNETKTQRKAQAGRARS